MTYKLRANRLPRPATKILGRTSKTFIKSGPLRATAEPTLARIASEVRTTTNQK
jgi:hypothetical protein